MRAIATTIAGGQAGDFLTARDGRTTLSFSQFQTGGS